MSWYEEILVGFSIALIGTHVLLLPAFWISIRSRLALSAEQVAVTAVASFIYHTCLAFSQCAANLSLWFVTRLDHVSAISLVVRVILQQTMIVVPRAGPAFRLYRKENPGVTDRMLADDLFWAQFFAYIATFVAVYLFFAWDPTTTFLPTVTMIAIACILAAFKIVLVGEKAQPLNGAARFRTNWKFFGCGVALMLASIALYASPEYVISHNGWHLASFVGYGLVQYSYVRVVSLTPPKQAPRPITATGSTLYKAIQVVIHPDSDEESGPSPKNSSKRLPSLLPDLKVS